MRGVINLNPFNIKDLSPASKPDPWIGQRDRDAQMHAMFWDVACSARGLLRILFTFGRKHKLRTLNQMMGRWSPENDTLGSIAGTAHNNPNAAAAYIAKRLGIDPDQELDLFDADGKILYGKRNMIIKGMQALIEYECGPDIVYDEATFTRGCALYEFHRKKGKTI